MARMTLNYYRIVNDPNYDFWKDLTPDRFLNGDKALLEEFKLMFDETYYRYEIGYETVQAFKHEVYAHIRKRNPYWTKLYETELRSEDIDFMLNKDYTETFVKDTENQSLLDAITKAINESSGSDSMSSTSNSKGSDINDGVSSPSLSQDFLTSVNQDTSTSNGSTHNKGSNESNSKTTGNEIGKESYTLIGKGNIGITSSAELLEKWRSVLISILEIIVDELRIHFSYYYGGI